MKPLRRLSDSPQTLTPEGWLNHVHPPTPPDPQIIPTYCSWCGADWLPFTPYGHHLCPVCDHTKEGAFA
jgi:hypothetical protein